MNRLHSAVAVTLAMGCSGAAGCALERTAPDPVIIGVAAAPSLDKSLTEIISVFEDEHPGVRVSLELGRSDTLSAELQGRDDINVYMSASPAAMQAAVDSGTVEAPRVFAQNHVVLAVPSGNPHGVRSLQDLARPELSVGICEPSLPCGEAAATLLGAAGVSPATVNFAEGSRLITARLADNALDAGVVYRTDVAASHGWVEQAPLSDADRKLEQLSGTTSYTIARVPGGASGDDAEAERIATTEFIELINSDRGRRALEDTGIKVLPG